MNLSKDSRLWLGVVAVLVLLVAVLYLVTPETQEEVVVKIATDRLVGGLPLFVALDQGLIEGSGVKYTTDEFATASLVADSLVAGKHDVGGPIGMPDMIIIESKEPGRFKIFSVFAEPSDSPISQIVVKKGSSISSVDQLAGKKVGIGPGVTPDFLARSFFSKMNVTGVELVVIAPNIWIQSLASGSVDAVYMIDPLATIAIDAGVGESIFSGPESAVIDPMPIVATAFTSEFVSLHPAEASRIVSALDRSVGSIEDSPESARSSLSAMAGIPSNVTDKINLGRSYDSRFSRSTVDNVQEMADLMLEMGYIDKEVDVSSMFYR